MDLVALGLAETDGVMLLLTVTVAARLAEPLADAVAKGVADPDADAVGDAVLLTVALLQGDCV